MNEAVCLCFSRAITLLISRSLSVWVCVTCCKSTRTCSIRFLLFPVTVHILGLTYSLTPCCQTAPAVGATVHVDSLHPASWLDRRFGLRFGPASVDGEPAPWFLGVWNPYFSLFTVRKDALVLTRSVSEHEHVCSRTRLSWTLVSFGPRSHLCSCPGGNETLSLII